MSAFLIRMLAESSIRSALVTAAAAAILGALRLRTASIRHAVWTAVLSAMLLMPGLPYLTPAITLPESLSLGERLSLTDGTGNKRTENRGSLATEFRRLTTVPAVAVDPRVGPVQASSPAPRSFVGVTADPLAVAARRASSVAPLGLALYAAVALLLFVRCWMGYRRAARIASDGQRVELRCASHLLLNAPRSAVLAESPAVVTPMTVGAMFPVVLLPTAWRTWSEERIRAVIAHELAHVRRRDPLIGLLARINRCLFWFHPVAWWLMRVLDETAEEACDEAAVRAIGAREAYAEALLDMAQLVGRRASRVAWRGVGMDGGGLLERRIDHVLTVSPSADVSRRRKTAAALTCAAAVFVVVSCRPRATDLQVSTAAIEERDRKLHDDLVNVSRTQFPVGDIDRSPDRAAVEALEAAATREPDDLNALRSLLVDYWIQPPADIAKRRDRILWLIEHHPEAPLAGSIEARLFPTDLEPTFSGDPVGYERARALWLSLAGSPNASSRLLGNAAAFLETTDPSRSERLLLRARAADPSGPWTAQLGRLYATVLAGSSALSGRNRSRRLSDGAARTAVALGIRKTLGESHDDELLTATGWFLARGIRGPSPFREFDPDYWGEWCFRRALQVKPAAVLAHTELLEIRSRRSRNRGEPLWREPPVRAYESVAELPEAERFELLPHLARSACQSLESMARWDDDPLIRDRMALSKRDAKRYAEDALALAPKYRNHPQYGTAIYLANMALGTLALRDGDRKKAALFLRYASKAPVSEELAYSHGIVSSHQWHLVADLLKLGERDAVLDFLDRMSTISIADRVELREAAAAIRDGGIPRL